MRVALTLAALLTAAPATAQTASMCGSYAETAAQLGDKYHEARVGAGIQGAGLVELWAAADGATWTLLLRMGGDRSCVIGAGEGWQAVKPEPADDGNAT